MCAHLRARARNRPANGAVATASLGWQTWITTALDRAASVVAHRRGRILLRSASTKSYVSSIPRHHPSVRHPSASGRRCCRQGATGVLRSAVAVTRIRLAPVATPSTNRWARAEEAAGGWAAMTCTPSSEQQLPTTTCHHFGTTVCRTAVVYWETHPFPSLEHNCAHRVLSRARYVRTDTFLVLVSLLLVRNK